MNTIITPQSASAQRACVADVLCYPQQIDGRYSDVTYFRQRKPGPEIEIEDAVARCIPDLFPSNGDPRWTAGSLTIGSGMPDLLIASYEPQLFALAHVEMPDAQILAYLRAVRHARMETIAERVGRPHQTVIRCLDGLVKAKAISSGSQTFSMSPKWRSILPEITTVEAKVTNWKKAVDQAARNRIFAHRSYIALPASVAQRIRLEPVFQQFGLGLIAVSGEDEVTILRRARRSQPKVWAYYYQLAFQIATQARKENNRALHSTNERSSNCIS